MSLALRVALTGASGFVGRHVVSQLLARGHVVRALYRTAPPAPATGTTVVIGDLADANALAELVSDCDVVLHVAGAISARDDAGFHAVNVEGTRAVVKAAVAAHVRRLVHVSSLAARQPSLSPYAASKRRGEDVVVEAASKLSTLILRPCAIYGPGDGATLPLLKQLMSRFALLPGRPHQRFSLLQVEDFARVCVAAVEAVDEGIREVDDLSGGHGWDDLVALTRAAFGRPERRFFVPYACAYGLGAVSSVFTRIVGTRAMLTTGKVREMYQADWVVRGENWPRANPVMLAEGLIETIRWHQERGELPSATTPPRSAGKRLT